MKRILMYVLPALVLAGSFLYLVQAAEAFKDPDSPYDEREYTHQQWMRVFAKVGNNPERLIDANWRSVFNLPGTLTAGYTADHANNVSPELANWLRAANLYDAAEQNYLLSAEGAKGRGLGSPYLQYTYWNRNIPIKSTNSDAEMLSVFGNTFQRNPGATKHNPIMAHRGPPSDIYWDGSRFHYAISPSPVDGARRGVINLSERNNAHRAFVNPANPMMGYGELHLYFPYDTMFMSYAPVIWDEIRATEKAIGYISVLNLSPWLTLPSHTKFRTYTWVNGEPEPKLNGTIKDLALTQLTPEPVSFEFTAPDKPFRLILTVNMYWSGGRWVNEPLRTNNSFDGGMNIVSAPEQDYARNKVEVSLVPGARPGQDQNTHPANLAVTALELLNRNGQPVSGTVVVNEPYKVRATFSSTFDRGGWTKIRFYVKREAGWMEFRGDQFVYFEPGAKFTHTWDWTGMTENVTLMATINYRWWDQQNNWLEELFDGERETTYEDNKKELNTAGTSSPGGPPTPGQWEYPLYYHPVTEELVPIYGTITHERVVSGWQEIDYIPDNSKARVRVRLIE
ncbi:MAG: hypothetical protein AB1815_14320 [Bacillota bacterium]